MAMRTTSAIGLGSSTLKVDGLLKIYVASRDSVVCGVTQPYYQMVGQMDLTAGALADRAIESAPFGSVKALFW